MILKIIIFSYSLNTINMYVRESLIFIVIFTIITMISASIFIDDFELFAQSFVLSPVIAILMTLFNLNVCLIFTMLIMIVFFH